MKLVDISIPILILTSTGHMQFCVVTKAEPASQSQLAQATTTRPPEAPSSSASSRQTSSTITSVDRSSLVRAPAESSPLSSASSSPDTLSASASSTSVGSAAPASQHRTFLANAAEERNTTQASNTPLRQEPSTSRLVPNDASTSADSATPSSVKASTSATETSTGSRNEPSPLDPFGTNRTKAGLPNDGDGGLVAGSVAGIVIGILAVLSVLALLAFLCLRRKRKDDRQSRPISPPTLAGGNAAHTTSWIDFGGGRSSWDTLDEKAVPPIYNMYSNARSPRMFSAFSGSHASSDVMPSQPPPASLASHRTTLESRKSSMWFRMTPKWIDVKRATQPSEGGDYSAHTPSSFVLPASATPSVYHRSRSGGTSYFSRLLAHDRVLDRKRPAVSVKRVPSSEKLVEERPEGRTAQEEEELSFAHAVSVTNDIAGDLTDPASVSPGYPAVLMRRPSLPADVPADESDADDLKAASTRAPSVDLAWVTQGMFEASPTQSSGSKKVSIRRKAPPSVSSTTTRSKGRKSMPTISPTFSFRNSFHSSSVPSTPRTPRRNRESTKPPLPAMPDVAFSIGFESPALPSSNNSVAGISRPASTSTPTTGGRSARVGRAL